MSGLVRKSYSFGALAFESEDAAGEAQLELRRLEREGAVDLKDEAIAVIVRFQRVQNRRQTVVEYDIHNRANNLANATFIAHDFFLQLFVYLAGLWP